MTGDMKRMGALYRRHFRDPRRERMFLASLSFFVTFGATRLVTHAIRGESNLFRNVVFGETHVHHLVWGILLLLGVWYGLLLGGSGTGASNRPNGRMLAILYGAGAALTLDEFAVWLHLEDVYWERKGRASVDVAFLFGAIVSASLWGGPFLAAVARQRARISRLKRHRRGFVRY